MHTYEWDEKKNESNQLKHKIAFEDAVDVFNDENRIKFASIRKGEQRYLTIGKAHQAMICVIYTIRDFQIRIISARRTRKSERRDYLINKLRKSDDI